MKTLPKERTTPKPHPLLRNQANHATKKTAPIYFWVVIPDEKNLTPDERKLVEAGGPWPARKLDHLPEHELLVDFLIERSVESWTRSKG